MDAQMKKGILEILVLYTLKDEDAYGYTLVSEVTKYFKIAETALYPILRRLLKQEFLSSYSKEYNGRLRKYYSITDEGRKKLFEYAEELCELKKIIEVIIKGVQENE